MLLDEKLTSALARFRAVVYGDQIWTVGGVVKGGGAVATHNIIEVRSDGTVSSVTQFTPQPSLPELSCTAPVIFDGVLYTFGGRDASDSASHSWYRLTLPETKEPTKAPTPAPTSTPTTSPTMSPTDF